MPIPLRGPCNAAKRPETSTLCRALAAIHFVPIFKIGDPTGVGVSPFQEAIRAKYPIARFETDQALQIELTDGKVKPTFQDVPVWRFFDQHENWRISLTRESLGVETRAGYAGRADFVARVHELLDGIVEHLRPSFFTRVGVRFVNAASVDAWKDNAARCPEEIRGLVGHSELRQGQSVWRLGIDEGELILRTGMSPAGMSHDPAILDPSDEAIWFLDVDVFTEANIPADTAGVSQIVRDLTERARMIFGWAIGAQ